MGFRWKLNRPSWALPHPVQQDVLKETVDSNGVSVCSVVREDVSVSSASLPLYSDYQLSKLVNAGVPLEQIDSSRLLEGSAPSESDVENFVNSLDVKSEN